MANIIKFFTKIFTNIMYKICSICSNSVEYFASFGQIADIVVTRSSQWRFTSSDIEHCCARTIVGVNGFNLTHVLLNPFNAEFPPHVDINHIDSIFTGVILLTLLYFWI